MANCGLRSVYGVQKLGGQIVLSDLQQESPEFNILFSVHSECVALVFYASSKIVQIDYPLVLDLDRDGTFLAIQPIHFVS